MTLIPSEQMEGAIHVNSKKEAVFRWDYELFPNAHTDGDGTANPTAMHRLTHYRVSRKHNDGQTKNRVDPLMNYHESNHFTTITTLI